MIIHTDRDMNYATIKYEEMPLNPVVAEDGRVYERNNYQYRTRVTKRFYLTERAA